MGLAIKAYADVRRLPTHTRSDHCYDAEHVWAFAYPGFERSYRGLANADVLGVFEYSPESGYIGGVCYDVSESESHRFEAGSYKGYGLWRNRLAEVFLDVPPETVWHDKEQYVDAPFFELICFADNEGCIGHEAAADLLADFEAGRDKWADAWAATASDDPLGNRFAIEAYEDWTLACRLAAKSGLIEFR